MPFLTRLRSPVPKSDQYITYKISFAFPKSKPAAFRNFPGFWMYGLLFWIIFPCVAHTQLYTLIYKPQEISDVRALNLSLKPGYPYDTVYIKKQIPEMRKRLMDEGYLYQQFKGLRIYGDTCELSWNTGPQLHLSFQTDSFGQSVLEQSGLTSKLRNLSVDSAARTVMARSVGQYLSNNGFPLSKVYFTRSFTGGDSLVTRLHVIPGPFIVFNDLELPEKAGISKTYLRNMLGFQREAPYNASLVLDIERKVNNLTFLKLTSPPKISFLAEKATVFLPIADQKASRFDFLIGVLPTVEDGIRKWNVNGEFLADFVNKLGLGERLGLQFKRLTLEDQFLKLNASVPFILSTPFGINGDFEIRRNRNISIDLTGNVGGSYFINTQNQLKMFWTYKSSELFNPDIEKIRASGALPKNLDLRFQGGSIEYSFSKLDYIFNPKQGINLRILTSLGNRSIVRNQQILQIEGIDFEAKYDSLGRRNIQVVGEVEVDHYTPAFGIGTFRNRLLFSYKYNNGSVIQNELYRIGGNKLLRGFDELSFLTDLYMMYSGEFRLILDRNSYLNLPFIDLAMMRNRNNAGTGQLVPAYGIGMGMNFATKAGIFNISFAAGNYDNRGFDFANTKIHFGYLNLF